jgi:formylmethanofuran dehydrogenase subunit E
MKTIEDAAGFHGHVCPGLALGYRVSLLALKELGKRAEDEELVAVVENDSCAVDAVQVMTGCTFGKGNLMFKDHGKQVYTFIRRGAKGAPKGDAIRISVEWVSPEETPEEKAAWAEYMKGDRSKEVLRKAHARKSKKIDAILKAKDSELFRVKRIKVVPPGEARIYPSVRCEVCGESVMEPRARVRAGKVVCIPCFERAGR